MILTDGGDWCLEVMHKFLCDIEREDIEREDIEREETKPMVIIMKGSGKLADLLSSVHKEYTK